MSLIESIFYSKTLTQHMWVNVILPDSCEGTGKKEKYPVLYLLHGLSGDHTDWVRFSRVESYAQKKGIAVVMPQMANSYYCNQCHGGRYFDLLTQELPYIMEHTLPISSRAEDRFIAGLSMGGYGALLAGLRCNENYAAIGSLSGRMGIKERGGLDSGMEKPWLRSFLGENGECYDPQVHEPLHILRGLKAENKRIPQMYITCGTEDAMYPDTVNFRDEARKIGVDMTYDEFPGVHDWDFWDPAVKKFIEWLPVGA